MINKITINKIEPPFDSIENAQQYVKLLEEAVAEAKSEIGNEIILSTDQMLQRRVQALRVVEYNLEKLHRHLRASGRALSDLRSLRRLLRDERKATNGTEHHKVATTKSVANTTLASEPLLAKRWPISVNL
jgi:hypothetical protein